MQQQKLNRALWLLALICCVGLAGANLKFGDLNQDEGWYLYAARLVSTGERPYADFAFMQPPLLPYVYGTIGAPFVNRMGVEGGRLFTAIMGIASALIASMIALRVSRRDRRSWAALIAFILCGVNVYQSYFTTIVKTYALGALLLSLGFLALSFLDGRRPMIAAALGGISVAMATGARVSIVFTLPAVFFVLLWRRRFREAAVFTIGAMVGGCAVFLPSLLAAPENFLFCVVKYHTAREVGSGMAKLVYKAGFISRVVRAYFVPIGLGVAAGMFAVRSKLVSDETVRATATDDSSRPAAPDAARIVVPALWASVLLVSLVHFAASFPYDDYQVVLLPVFAAAVAAGAAAVPSGRVETAWLGATVFLLSVAAAGSSPMNQEWFIGGRDRIWWRTKDTPALAKLQDTAKHVRDLAGADGLILTQDTYLALEAGLEVPRGLEMGPFCYYPEMDTETAERLHVLNKELMLDLVRETGAKVAAISGYGFSIGCPEVEELSDDEHELLTAALLEHYEEESTVKQFGQALTTLKIFVRK